MCRRVLMTVATTVFFALPATASDLLPSPKHTAANYQAIAENGGGQEPDGRIVENKNCHFLCEIHLLNRTGTKVKVWVRATLIGYPGVVVDIPAECFGKHLVASPCAHPWSIWFEQIRIGAWDGETSHTIGVLFKNECCKRRYVIQYDWLRRIRIVER